MAEMEAMPASEPAQNLVQLIKQLIKEEQYEGVALLFTSVGEAEHNLTCIPAIAMELLHDVCLQHLNDKNLAENPQSYSCAEELLKIVAAHAPMEELLLELLELVEEQKSEYVFTSTLRALQVVLLRMGDSKPRALEWSLNSIHSRIEKLPLPEYLNEGYDKKQERLLEQDEKVQTVLMHYITVKLFYEPLLEDILAQPRKAKPIFHDCDTNRCNVLCSFLIQLLDKPLALLDLAASENKSNAYTVQCARDLATAATQCIINPLYFMDLGERRVRWKRHLDYKKGVYEMSSSNMFLIEEKFPLSALAIYFYMVLVVGVSAEAIPKIYAPLFVFEGGLYFVAELLHNESPLKYRGVLLAKQLLMQLQQTLIPAISLELEVHKNFCSALCNIVGYSSLIYLRQEGVRLLRMYILQFDDEGKYLILKNLMHTIGHVGISGYLSVLYKDLVAEALSASTNIPLPSSFSGQDFRKIFLQNICHLPHGAQTDIMEHADKIIAALNAVRFFALKDYQNRTGFWNFVQKVQRDFLEPIRVGLDISVAHYKAELYRIKQGLNSVEEAAEREKLELLDVSIQNATSESGNVDMEINQQQKISILGRNLCTFDLMRSLLARVTECLESASKSLKSMKEMKVEAGSSAK